MEDLLVILIACSVLNFIALIHTSTFVPQTMLVPMRLVVVSGVDQKLGKQRVWCRIEYTFYVKS